jgi:glycosyltransferase involved in cell wall biosynthesis
VSSTVDVSVVVPVFDRVAMLRRTLLSLIGQRTDVAYEIIIVFDGSPDDTRSVVSSIEYESSVPIRRFSFSSPSGTACRGRNLGIIEAKGQYIAFSDSDDISVDTRLQTSFDAITQLDVDLVAGRVRYVVDPSRPIEIVSGSTSEVVPLTLGLLKLVNPVAPSTVMVSRDILLAHGGFRTSLRYREDHELWLRLAHRGVSMFMLDEVLADYMIHAGNNELNFLDSDDEWSGRALRDFRLAYPREEWGVATE